MSDLPCTALVIGVIYRDGSHAVRRVTMADDLINEFCNKLASAEGVKSLAVGREMFYGHNSFKEDFDPERLAKFVAELASRSASPLTEDK